MEENERLLDRQKEDNERNRRMIENVKEACVDLDHVSGETLTNADSIYVSIIRLIAKSNTPKIKSMLKDTRSVWFLRFE